MREDEVFDPRTVGPDLFLKTRGLRFQRFGIVVEIDEDEAAELFDPDRLEGEILLVEPGHFLGVAGAAQRAVEFVGPGVIGAHQDARLAAAMGEFMTAVLADIVKGAEFAVAPARDHHGLFMDRGREIGAGFGELALMAGEPPVPVEDCILLERIDLRVAVEPRGDRVGVFCRIAKWCITLVQPQYR